MQTCESIHLSASANACLPNSWKQVHRLAIACLQHLRPFRFLRGHLHSLSRGSLYSSRLVKHTSTPVCNCLSHLGERPSLFLEEFAGASANASTSASASASAIQLHTCILAYNCFQHMSETLFLLEFAFFVVKFPFWRNHKWTNRLAIASLGPPERPFLSSWQVQVQVQLACNWFSYPFYPY